MCLEPERYLNLPLGLSAAEARRLLGEPGLITAHCGEQQWFYEEGRFALTFAGQSPRLVRIARRPDSGLPPVQAKSSPSALSSKAAAIFSKNEKNKGK